MYNPKFTESTPLPEPDPLSIQVFLQLHDRPPYVDDDLAKRIAATVASCGDLPSAEAITLFAAAGVHIRERCRGKAADGHMAELLSWAAIQHDRAKGEEDVKWFIGDLRARIWLHGIEWIQIDEVPSFGGFLGCVAPAIRKTLHGAPDFVPYWLARQGAPFPPMSQQAPTTPPPAPPEPPEKPRKPRTRRKAQYWQVDTSTTEDRATRRETGLKPLMAAQGIKTINELSEQVGRVSAVTEYATGITINPGDDLLADIAVVLKVPIGKIPR